MTARTPPFFLAAAVLFWGWNSGQLALAVALAAIVEAPRYMRARWHLNRTELSRVADLCTWTFIILIAFLTFTRGMPIPILKAVQWLPLVLLPLMAAQLFSAAGAIELGAVFLALRGNSAEARSLGGRAVDLSYAYALVCVLAAGAANTRDEWFYPGAIALAGWALWTVRPRRYRAGAWLAMLASAIALGYGGQLALHRLQEMLIDSAFGWFAGGGARTDPYRNTTDIGSIGELKQSDRILLRIVLPAGQRLPLLLHTASYDSYAAPTWLARSAPLEPLAPEPERSSWKLDGSDRTLEGILVFARLTRGKAVLALPAAVARVEDLSALEMRRNRLGTVEIAMPGDLFSYRALPAADLASAAAPSAGDLRVPTAEAAVLERIVDEQQLAGKTAPQIVRGVRQYFERGFRYSTYLPGSAQGASALTNFLLVTRAGHCEYFATATVLLLRAAGVPARYATGFSVQELSALERGYIARERHAHAWARAWVDGRWQDFDTTPADWLAAEDNAASSWQSVADLASWLSFRWQIAEADARLGMALTVIIPLALFLLWRLFFRQRIALARAARPSLRGTQLRQGSDSEFYLVEARLAAQGLRRAAAEPMTAWLARVAALRGADRVSPLHELLRLHYRYRFDPCGLSPAERETLRTGAQRWLKETQ